MNTRQFFPKIAVAINKISPSLRFKLQYFHHRGRFPNLNNPKNLSEIIGSEMISHNVDAYSDLVDKIKVRDYLKEWGLDKYLPQVYAIWKCAEDIKLNDLPDRFILKTNHGSGGHIICTDKTNFDIDMAIPHFKKLLASNYSSLETQYQLISPVVYAEELISDGHNMPTDYKFLCLDGQIKAILLCFDRDADIHKLVYNEKWEKLPYIRGTSYSDKEYPCPDNFEEMKYIVRKIASRFTQVRVDLYNSFGKIYIGELTFTADGGILRNFTTAAIKEMGR